MWTAIPTSQLCAWDGHCIYKIKDGSRRCKLSAGADTDARRFGNRNELISKIRRGVSLTRQEKTELARGLCCLRWHSTEDIAQEICELWAGVPVTVLVPPPPQQSEIQSLKSENEMLAKRLQGAKTMEKQYYESWVGTFPHFKSLKNEVKDLQKQLEETRQVKEVSEDGNEFLTTKFGFQKNEVSPKSTVGVAIATTKTPISVTPVNNTAMSKFITPGNTKMIESYSLEHASTSDCTLSTKEGYSPSFAHYSGASSSDSLLRTENSYQVSDIANPDVSLLTPFSAIINKYEAAKSYLKTASGINKLSYHCNVTTLSSAPPESTGSRELVKAGPLKVSPSAPMGSLQEKSLKNFVSIVILFCWVGNVSFGQFIGLVICTSFVLWNQVLRGGIFMRYWRSTIL